MILLYDETTGKIYYSVKDSEYLYFTHSTNIPLTELYIDEYEEDNKPLIIDLLKYGNEFKVNEEGKHKYYINWTENPEFGLCVIEGWVRHIDEELII